MRYGRKIAYAAAFVTAFFVLTAVLSARQNQRMTASTAFVMDTSAVQTVYGKNSEQAVQAVEAAMREMEARLSLYVPGSDTERLMQQAGEGPVTVDARTAELLQRVQALGQQTNGAFQMTVAPLSLAWGISGNTPRIPTDAEINALLPLVNDEMLVVEGETARLLQKGMAVDLGGVAKGAACDEAKALYEQYGIRSALCSLGGSSIYALGTKPGGKPWRLGFRDPESRTPTSLVSFSLEDAAFSVSGGYERFFEVNGERYQHILDPQTGRPARTDIVSIGVLCQTGWEADLWSTALYVQGKEAALAYFQAGGEGILLDEEDVLYITESLRPSLDISGLNTDRYRVEYIAKNR